MADAVWRLARLISARRSDVLDHAEALFKARVCICAVVGVAGQHAFLELLHVADLALVFQQRVQLGGPGGAHVHDSVGLLCERDPDLAWHVRFETLADQLGEVLLVARRGKTASRTTCPAAR